MERSDLELVLAIRDCGSLTAAALRLDVAPPVVTKRLAALEGRLGQRLFQRTTRRVSPTAEGETLCERALVLLLGFATLEAELQEQKKEPTGLIRLAATFGFGRLWLGPALARFQERYPRIEIQLQLTEQLPDLALNDSTVPSGCGRFRAGGQPSAFHGGWHAINAFWWLHRTTFSSAARHQGWRRCKTMPACWCVRTGTPRVSASIHGRCTGAA